MADRNQDSPLIFAPDLDALKGLVGSLNTEFFRLPLPVKGVLSLVKGDYRPVRLELRRLVQAWFDSGPNVVKLFSADPVLAQAALHCRAHLIPTKTGRAQLICVTAPENLPPGDPLEIALGLFLSFLINPYNAKLGGPCRHCDKYYVKKTKRQVVYCSKRCGLKHTSKTAIEQNRQREHLDDLDKARRSSAEWSKSRTSLDWKEWVKRDATISKHFLTRAIRNEELVAPVRKPLKIR